MAHQSGIAQHSSPGNNWVIFSVSKGTDAHADWVNTCLTINTLEDNKIPFKRLEGTYKGSAKETSFIINEQYSDKALEIAVAFNQDSVLLLDNHKHGLYKATLLYIDGHLEPLGYLRSVGKEIAESQQSYTFDPSQDKYFITTHSDATQYRELHDIGLA